MQSWVALTFGRANLTVRNPLYRPNVSAAARPWEVMRIASYGWRHTDNRPAKTYLSSKSNAADSRRHPTYGPTPPALATMRTWTPPPLPPIPNAPSSRR